MNLHCWFRNAEWFSSVTKISRLRSKPSYFSIMVPLSLHRNQGESMLESMPIRLTIANSHPTRHGNTWTFMQIIHWKSTHPHIQCCGWKSIHQSEAIRHGRVNTACTDALSDSMKKYMDGLHAVHTSRLQYDTKLEMFESRPNHPPIDTNHPAVRTHPVTGLKALNVNPGFVTGFAELKKKKSGAFFHFKAIRVQLNKT